MVTPPEWQFPLCSFGSFRGVCASVCTRTHVCLSRTTLFRAPLGGFFSQRLPPDKQDTLNAKIAFAFEVQEGTISFLQARKGERTRRPLLLRHPQPLPAQDAAHLSSNLQLYSFRVPGSQERMGPAGVGVGVGERLFRPAHSILRHVLSCQEWKAWSTLSLFDQKTQRGMLPRSLAVSSWGCRK